MTMKFNELKKTLGPGILFASTCIGVSHLVQSTRAGADYGFLLVGAVILANIFKYPFFEFASRYTSATGKSIIDGYYKKSKWILVGYLVITIFSMFIVSAAVTFVTAGLFSNLFHFNLDTAQWAGILLAICILLLIVGKFKLLDSTLKIVGMFLLLSTIIAVVSSLVKGRVPQVENFVAPELLNTKGILFLIALMGWMPTAVDMSTWTSLWTEERIKQTNYHPTLKETLFDFKLGYFASAILAVCFLTLGAMILYGNGVALSNSAPTFANQLITMFTSVIGDWSYFIILIAAFSTMFSTTITVIDGYCRGAARSIKLFRNKSDDSRTIYIVTAIVLSLGTYMIISQYLNNLKSLVDFATALSFIIAPLAGWVNYKMVFTEEIPLSHQPKKWLKSLAKAGLVFMSVFTVIYFYALFAEKF
ncbi:MAG: divalent metal cation transporter [Cyclobacteriaceae bacterium]|nr:divalent metal cation transporter [Cyclobacteriaceae bacterium]